MPFSLGSLFQRIPGKILDNKGEVLMKQFPPDFLWGGATADFQYEGGFNEGGRGLCSQDYVTAGSVPTIYEDEYYPSFKAVDFYLERARIFPLQCTA